jgi:hypothetical protein
MTIKQQRARRCQLLLRYELRRQAGSGLRRRLEMAASSMFARRRPRCGGLALGTAADVAI